MDTNELRHHGILGMKWGRRRYQNKDGSLTAAGKKRYGDSDGEDKKEETPKKKSVSEMTDDELNKAIRRAQMEDQYRALRPEPVSAGKKFMDTMIGKVIAPAAVEAGSRFLKNTLNKYADEILKETKEPSKVEKMRKEVEELELKTKLNKLKKHNDDDDVNWENRIKKQTYMRNEEEAERQRQKDKADAAAKAKQEKANAKKESKSNDEPETVTGEIFGEGTSKFSWDDPWPPKNGSAKTTYDYNCSTGESFISGLLALPKKDDD